MMYKRYRIEENDELELLVSNHKNKGKDILERRRRNIERDLDMYVNQNGFIDFSAVEEDWFPQVNCDIFLSHSHKDIDLVNGLVGWLYEKFHVEVFVDSYIWGYCNKLQKIIDDKHCKNFDKKTYSYEKRNISTSHVHMMLANSLNKMIDKAECIIFLETDNSLDVKYNVEKDGTSSAWIYSELIASKIIRTRAPERLHKFEERTSKSIGMIENFIPTGYRGEKKHLKLLSVNDLIKVENKRLKTKFGCLDELYRVAKEEV